MITSLWLHHLLIPHHYFLFVLCWFYENHKFDWFMRANSSTFTAFCAFCFWFICWLMLNDVFPQESEPTTRSDVVERDVKFPESPCLIGHMSQPKPTESRVERWNPTISVVVGNWEHPWSWTIFNMVHLLNRDIFGKGGPELEIYHFRLFYQVLLPRCVCWCMVYGYLHANHQKYPVL